MMMPYFSYAIIFVANFYTSVKIFGLGWSTKPASFTEEFSAVALITLIAGVLAAIPKKTDWKIVAVCSVIGPASVCGLMAQGILTNQAFHLLHWLLVPIGGAAISVLSFFVIKKLFNRD